MNVFEEIYQQKCRTVSDINEHLPVLRQYAEECEHITEMGVRFVVSTYALLSGKPLRMISYDIVNIDWSGLKSQALENGTDYEFRNQDVREVVIEETDLLFIDTLHIYPQLKKELELHAPKVRKYIILHDTETFGFRGEMEGEVGLWPAVEEFLENNKQWQLKEKRTNNNGLTVLKRI